MSRTFGGQFDFLVERSPTCVKHYIKTVIHVLTYHTAKEHVDSHNILSTRTAL